MPFRSSTALGRSRGYLSAPAAVSASRLLVWVFVVLGASGGVLALLRPAPRRLAPLASRNAEAPARVAGFAELAVRRWLNGSAGDAPPDVVNVASARGADSRPVVLATSEVAALLVTDGYWAVTVGVEVAQADREPGVWFVEIGVVDTPQGLLAAGAPAVVPSPLRTGSASPAGRAFAVPAPGDPIATTAQAFLDALLAGRGDLSRYLAPGTRMTPVTPSFDSVVVQRLAEVATTAQRRTLRVDALATTAGAGLDLGYELTLELRAGRWEVRRMSGAPTLRTITTRTTAETAPTFPPANPTTTSLAPATPGA